MLKNVAIGLLTVVCAVQASLISQSNAHAARLANRISEQQTRIRGMKMTVEQYAKANEYMLDRLRIMDPTALKPVEPTYD